MNRHFKFRAWDKKRNEWYGVSNNLSLAFNGFHLFGECMAFCFPRLEDLEFLVVTQYTGKLVRNDNEVCEGDIVTDCHGNNGVVFFSQDHCQFLVNMGEGIDFQEIGDWCEIIGNIYENPDLIAIKE